MTYIRYVKTDFIIYQVDFVKEYWNDVFVPFLDAYERGIETPNPDVACNRFIKFKSFQNHVKNTMGIQAMATGHYARLKYTAHRPDSPGGDENSPLLMTAVDTWKDQSYFLCTTTVLTYIHMSYIHPH